MIDAGEVAAGCVEGGNRRAAPMLTEDRNTRRRVRLTARVRRPVDGTGAITAEASIEVADGANVADLGMMGFRRTDT